MLRLRHIYLRILFSLELSGFSCLVLLVLLLYVYMAFQVLVLCLIFLNIDLISFPVNAVNDVPLSVLSVLLRFTINLLRYNVPEMFSWFCL